MDAFLDHQLPRIARWAGWIVMTVTAGLMALCVIGALSQPEAAGAWLVLLVGDAFLCWIGSQLADTEDGAA